MQSDEAVQIEQYEKPGVVHTCVLCGYKAMGSSERTSSGIDILPEGWIYLPGGYKSCSTTMYPQHPSTEEAAPGRGILLTGYLFSRLLFEKLLGIKREYPFDWEDPHQGD